MDKHSALLWMEDVSKSFPGVQALQNVSLHVGAGEILGLIGQNGAGKTSLLEAVYYLMQGTSFRGRDRDMIAHSSTRTDLVLIADNEDKRVGSLQITPNGTIKKASLSRAKQQHGFQPQNVGL